MNYKLRLLLAISVSIFSLFSYFLPGFAETRDELNDRRRRNNYQERVNPNTRDYRNEHRRYYRRQNGGLNLQIIIPLGNPNPPQVIYTNPIVPSRAYWAFPKLNDISISKVVFYDNATIGYYQDQMVILNTPQGLINCIFEKMNNNHVNDFALNGILFQRQPGFSIRGFESLPVGNVAEFYR